MILCKLTAAKDGRPVYVNPAQVVALVREGNVTHIFTTATNSKGSSFLIDVAESEGQVSELLMKA